MFRMPHRLLVAAIALPQIFLLPSPVSATLLEDTITGELCFGVGLFGNCVTNEFVVNAAPGSSGIQPQAVVSETDASFVEFMSVGIDSSFFNVDVDSGSVSITQNLGTSGAPFNSLGWLVILSDLDWLPDPGQLLGLQNVVSTFPIGAGIDFQASPDVLRISADVGSFQADVNELTLSFDLETAHTPVPEPVTLALFSSGLAGLAFLRRRRIISA